jgi:hypothetical protein
MCRALGCLWDWKISVDCELMRPRDLAVYAKACGPDTRTSARSGWGDPIAIAAYFGGSRPDSIAPLRSSPQRM